jgi:ABC-2 type transport system ATP-binding protein
MAPILEVEGLTKSYPGFRLEGINFTLGSGEVMGFIGPNGAGKTTTIRMLMGLVRPDGGSIRLFGEDPAQSGAAIRERIGFVYDEGKYYGNLTVGEMKRVIAPFYKHWDEDAFQRYAVKFELPGDKKIGDLSRGTKMKFAIAAALSHRAELIIMDEPTSGLDPVFRSELLDILFDVIQDESKSVFFSTHVTNDLEKIADRIVFIESGRLVFAQSMDEVMERYKIVRGPVNLLSDDLKTAFVNVRETEAGFIGLTEDANLLSKFPKGATLVERASLEEIMVAYARRQPC